MIASDGLLAWRNIWRNPRRSILTILAIVFATGLLVFMLSFQLGSYEDMIDSSVQLSSGHFQIQSPEYNNRQEMHLTIAAPDNLLPQVLQQPGVRGAAIRSEAFALAAGRVRTRGAQIMGVDPEREHGLSSLSGQIIAGRYLQPQDTDTAIIGTLLAQRLQLALGEECTLLGQGKDGSIAATVVRIVGIFKTGIDVYDRSTLLMPRPLFNDVFTMGDSAHRIVVIMDHLGEINPTLEALKNTPVFQDLNLLSWDQLIPGLRQSIELDLISGVIMYLILVIVVAFSILNTFFMAIFERTREFGVLLSIGARPARLVRMILLESMTMTCLGISLGMFLGGLVTIYFTKYGIGFGEAGELFAQYGISERLYPQLSLLTLCTGPVIIFIITFITALIPALKIPALKPVEAMRAC